MILAAHQPHYLPWLGYLDKMARADLFVIMDDLQYEAQNFQNRNRIKLATGDKWLTVPLVRGSQSDRISDKLINNDGNPKQHWQRRHWITLENTYRKADYWHLYADELRPVYERPWVRLLDLDLEMLRLARRWLGITTPLCFASELHLVGQKSDLLLDMCVKTGTTVYLSGSGGSASYLDVDAFERAGITVEWQQFHHPDYPQRFPERGFVSHLPFLDLLFNCGPHSRAILDSGAVPALPLAKAS